MIYTKKMRRELKVITIKNKPNKKRDVSAENEKTNQQKQPNYKVHKKQTKSNKSKSLLRSNYFKYNWIRLLNQKTEIRSKD